MPAPKRKRQLSAEAPTTELKRQKSKLSGPHEPIVATLQAKVNVLVASVISSTQIRKRVASATTHLSDKASPKPRVVLLHARPAQVCKLITVVEHCKRLLRPCYQYNQLYDLPATTTAHNDDDDDDESFEDMDISRLEKVAVALPPTRRPVKSMRVFLAVRPIPELEALSGVTLQSSDVAVSSEG
ncbi:hypothetical protein L249_8838 [Ophiocordyceps polyrhachis-furcata BCC 54312]|uniref:DNA/RNA-binding protein Alba-like domain-containing protein n=1 Tax=Ophiocordyceps polyrhachis-furcata BCC 54312 TaxID=1330021 RepID=A0A367L1Q0_9HYPO|nr:hypothetical protein L249_8838 [Ophiocordyceps polyrhachis-furcata BCC 54312]